MQWGTYFEKVGVCVGFAWIQEIISKIKKTLLMVHCKNRKMWYNTNVLKLSNIKGLLLFIFWGFILTMWYVNLKTLNLCVLYDMFYINYVICKFILHPNQWAHQNGFYINYVICKCYYPAISLQNKKEFYINYVICKYNTVMLFKLG